jgi:hypothetical protein
MPIIPGGTGDRRHVDLEQDPRDVGNYNPTTALVE